MKVPLQIVKLAKDLLKDFNENVYDLKQVFPDISRVSESNSGQIYSDNYELAKQKWKRKICDLFKGCRWQRIFTLIEQKKSSVSFMLNFRSIFLNIAQFCTAFKWGLFALGRNIHYFFTIKIKAMIVIMPALLLSWFVSLVSVITKVVCVAILSALFVIILLRIIDWIYEWYKKDK